MTDNPYVFTKDGIRSPLGGFLRFSTKPYDHQLKCLERFADAKYFALLAEMGTGKTWVMINNYAYLLSRGKVFNLLVVAPNGVQWNWVKNELPLHLPERVKQRVNFAAYGGGMHRKEKDAVFRLINEAGTKAGILCVNWDSLSCSGGIELVKKFLSVRADNMAVLDESDYCKNPSTKRAKTVISIKERSVVRRIMTGTPITNSPFDAWTQFNFLSSEILDCKSYIAFKARHGVFLPANHPLVRSLSLRGNKVPQIPAKDVHGRPIYKGLEQLKAKIAPYSFRVLKADCLDLPDKVYIKEYVELSKEQRTRYDLVKTQGIMLLHDEEIPVTNKMAILTYLCQIIGNHYSPAVMQFAETGMVSGAAAGQDSVINPECNPKLERALELITQAADAGKSVIVWARFRAEIFDLIKGCEQIGVPAVSYFGDSTAEERIHAVDALQNGTARVFISNPQSGGTGLTLTSASVVIYYSNSFSLHDRLQSEDRAHRIGQTDSKVTYIDLLARDTVDEQIQQCLISKNDVAKMITSFH